MRFNSIRNDGTNGGVVSVIQHKVPPHVIASHTDTHSHPCDCELR